ncbi:hypothetical protein, partial [Chitinophaga sp.]|uniref:hypothetical protein n=1 Tax=Chitinophaga sp. TaxID=1869181 RepID=UPI002F951B98
KITKISLILPKDKGRRPYPPLSQKKFAFSKKMFHFCSRYAKYHYKQTLVVARNQFLICVTVPCFV